MESEPIVQQMSDITLSDHLSDRVDRAHEELSNCSSYLEDTRAAIGKLMLVKDKDLIFERMLSNRKDELEWLSAMEQVRNAALYMAQLELQEASSGDLDQFHHTDETASDQDVLEGKDTFETMQDSVAPVSERMPPVIDPPRTLCCVDGNVTNATHPIATADRNADWRSWFDAYSQTHKEYIRRDAEGKVVFTLRFNAGFESDDEDDEDDEY